MIEPSQTFSRRRFVAGLALGATTAHAQSTVGANQNGGVVEQSIRSFIDDMYACIRFDRNQPMDTALLRRLMHPGATFAWAEEGGFRLVEIDEFIGLFLAGFERDGLWSLQERSLEMSAVSFGNVAQVSDTYEAVFNDGEVVVQGVNMFQLLRSANQWRCAALAWSEEPAAQK